MHYGCSLHDAWFISRMFEGPKSGKNVSVISAIKSSMLNTVELGRVSITLIINNVTNTDYEQILY